MREYKIRLVLPEVVASRLLTRIDQRVLHEVPCTTYSFHAQMLGVQSMVMMRTKKYAVVDASFTVLGPRFDVVEYAPGSRPETTGHSALTISRQNGSSNNIRE